MKKQCFICYSMIEDSLYPESLAVAIVLNGITHKDENQCCLNKNYLRYHMFGRDTTRSENLSIKKGLDELIRKDYIKIINNDYKMCFTIDVTNLNNKKDGEYYVLIDSKEFYQIMNTTYSINKFNLLKLYLIILNSRLRGRNINKKYVGKICMYDESCLCKLSGIHIESFRKYIECLENEKLIFKIRSNGCFYQKNTQNKIVDVRFLTNLYSRFKDKELCIEYAKENRKFNLKKQKTYNSDHSRSMKQIYNWLKKGKFDYKKEEIEMVKEYILDTNRKILAGKVKGEVLDTSVFEKYDQYQQSQH